MVRSNAIVAAVVVGAALPIMAEAAPISRDGIDSAVQSQSMIDEVQYRLAGREYCFYDDGWHGPGWYWCGYRLRSGYGWGGPTGWHGWREGAIRERGRIGVEERGRVGVEERGRIGVERRGGVVERGRVGTEGRGGVAVEGRGRVGAEQRGGVEPSTTGRGGFQGRSGTTNGGQPATPSGGGAGGAAAPGSFPR
jgi:hypothetical protein